MKEKKKIMTFCEQHGRPKNLGKEQHCGNSHCGECNRRVGERIAKIETDTPAGVISKTLRGNVPLADTILRDLKEAGFMVLPTANKQRGVK